MSFGSPSDRRAYYRRKRRLNANYRHFRSIVRRELAKSIETKYTQGIKTFVSGAGKAANLPQVNLTPLVTVAETTTKNGRIGAEITVKRIALKATFTPKTNGAQTDARGPLWIRWMIVRTFFSDQLTLTNLGAVLSGANGAPSSNPFVGIQSYYTKHDAAEYLGPYKICYDKTFRRSPSGNTSALNIYNWGLDYHTSGKLEYSGADSATYQGGQYYLLAIAGNTGSPGLRSNVQRYKAEIYYRIRFTDD